MPTPSLDPAGLERLVAAIEAGSSVPIPAPLRAMLAGVHHAYYSHEAFLAHYQRIDTDFVYDKTAGVYLVGLTGAHVDLLANLVGYYSNPGALLKAAEVYPTADRFVMEGFGMLKSRAGNRIYRGAGFAVPPQLQPILRDIEVLA